MSSNISWIGVMDTDWVNPANWQGGIVPDMNSNVTISAGVPFYPIIDENVTINTIEIEKGAAIQVQDNICFFVKAQ